MLMGFTLSLVSVVFNSLVITYVNRRLKEVDDERARLSDSLERQAAALSDGDSQFAFYRITHNLLYAVQPRDQEVVQTDSAGQLTKALQRYYQAAYDVPQTAITETENEDFGMRLPLMEKDLQLARQMDAASPEERARLQNESDDLRKQLPEPKSDLGRKLREFRDVSETAEFSGSEAVLFSDLLPVMRSFQDEMAKNTEKKRNRIRELQAARASLVKRSDYVSAAAVFLQLLGLMFILARDLWNQRVAAQQKAG